MTTFYVTHGLLLCLLTVKKTSSILPPQQGAQMALKYLSWHTYLQVKKFGRKLNKQIKSVFQSSSFCNQALWKLAY